ncbi:hypothetical protein [Kitasatospora sp. SUK 42]|uniref:hypothetical protein n=1 Tax=Kitasatospora sp. SUK 42 TaxID=1588882 RepID=UPI0018C93A40|nr:hypothetical protein [Kitasatospora sp. SUK 42]MBV2152913.1 hypothetical protein [Kitasatospora sp. SUK 42]
MSRLRRFVCKAVLMSVVGMTALAGYSAYAGSAVPSEGVATAKSVGGTQDLDIGWA